MFSCCYLYCRGMKTEKKFMILVHVLRIYLTQLLLCTSLGLMNLPHMSLAVHVAMHEVESVIIRM